MVAGPSCQPLMPQPAGQCSLPRTARTTAHINGIAAHIQRNECPHPTESSMVHGKEKETK